MKLHSSHKDFINLFEIATETQSATKFVGIFIFYFIFKSLQSNLVKSVHSLTNNISIRNVNVWEKI